MWTENEDLDWIQRLDSDVQNRIRKDVEPSWQFCNANSLGEFGTFVLDFIVTNFSVSNESHMYTIVFDLFYSHWPLKCIPLCSYTMRSFLILKNITQIYRWSAKSTSEHGFLFLFGVLWIGKTNRRFISENGRNIEVWGEGDSVQRNTSYGILFLNNERIK